MNFPLGQTEITEGGDCASVLKAGLNKKENQAGVTQGRGELGKQTWTRSRQL